MSRSHDKVDDGRLDRIGAQESPSISLLMQERNPRRKDAGRLSHRSILRGFAERV